MKEEIYWCYVNTGAVLLSWIFFSKWVEKHQKDVCHFFVKYGLWSWYLHYFLKNFISTDTFLSDMYKTCDERVFPLCTRI